MLLSKRIQDLPISPTRRFLGLAAEMEGKGKKIHRLSIGQPDIKAPDYYFDALKKIENGRVPYPNGPGLAQMREAQSRYYSKFNIDYKAEEIFITNGASQAIENALTAVCDVGDKVLLIEPYYTSYGMLTHILGLGVVAVTAKIEDNYKVPDIEEFEKLYDPSIKAILFSNPGNPTGKIYSREEIQTIVDFAKRHGLFIISDEVYREFCFTNSPFDSLYDFPEIRNQLVLIDSASKKYALCGARIGSLATKNEELQGAFLKLSQMRLGVSSTEQKAVSELINLGQDYFDEVKDLYIGRKNTLEECLSKVKNISYSKPEGAFYTIVSLPVKDASDFVVWLIKDFDLDGESILLTPIEDFYNSPGAGKNEVRISYCVSADILKRAIQILNRALEVYEY